MAFSYELAVLSSAGTMIHACIYKPDMADYLLNYVRSWLFEQPVSFSLDATARLYLLD